MARALEDLKAFVLTEIDEDKQQKTRTGDLPAADAGNLKVSYYNIGSDIAKNIDNGKTRRQLKTPT
ncbi:Hypothetical predicted protein [Paramuricea clavata]|uniref:Uncharacterized protein n=1 Tax=Paramuricea clavata TaxID=317549 RepID=A0A7D9DMT8_PARCT|nr:Hypothetical predicted protein [Paramuricea clavata]